MKRYSKQINKVFLGFMVSLLLACDGFLDPKPDQGLLVPKTLDDVQLLLDNNVVFNRQALLPTISSDEFWTTSDAYQNMTVPEQGSYLWKEDIYQGASTWDWDYAYRQVFYANIALEALEDILGNENSRAEELRGMALFYRAYAYYHLLQQFAPAYQKSGGNEGLLGIVLKSKSDINDPASRATLAESYNQLIGDLQEAVQFLPETTELKTRPNLAAGYALLAKSQLMMFDYEEAANSAIQALGHYPLRLDFNELDLEARRPFSRFDNETIFYSVLHSSSYTRAGQTFVDTLLTQTFEEGDLRVRTYYSMTADSLYNMTGHHTGNTVLFGGLSVGELQLIAAEGFGKIGDLEKGNLYLNGLLRNRYDQETWEDLMIEKQDELLERVLLERRKELIGRGIRWSDLRRLNQETGSEITLERVIDGETYSLLPNDPLYVFPIPDVEIQRSGIAQNER